MNGKAWWIAAALLLAAMGVAMVTAALGENQTWDEGVHLVSGYTDLVLGAHRLNREHPPLAKYLAALPLLALDLRLPLEHESWRKGDAVLFGAVFLYRNEAPPDTMLLLARLPMIGLALLLGAVLALWTKRRFGPVAGLAALFFYTTDPNFIAHGHYVASDVAAAFTIFLAVAAWARWLERRGRGALALAGLALGLALTAKFSTLFLLGLLPALSLAYWKKQPKRFGWRNFAGTHLAAAALALVTLAAAYGPATWRTIVRGEAASLTVYARQQNLVSRTLRWAGETMHLPAHPYLLGLNIVAAHNERGHPAYLLGEVSKEGRWLYFPVAFAVKTPTALLLLLGAGLWLGLSRLRVRRRDALPFVWFALLVAPLAYFALAMAGNLNLGLRHILPVYPFLYAAAGAAFAKLARGRAWALAALLLGLQVVETARIHPHHLAFFNTVSGGPAAGPRYLADSNIDWGQAVKHLAAWKGAQGLDDLVISYFGVTDLPYYLGKHRVLEKVCADCRIGEIDSVVAVSVTNLLGVYRDSPALAWLRKRRPDARIGWAIYVYDLRKDRGGE